MLSHRKSALLAESLMTTLACCTVKPLALGQLHATALPMQMLKVADTAAELRQLLSQEGLAADDLNWFEDADLDSLLEKRRCTWALLATADEAALLEPPPLPPTLRRALLAKFNPDALAASTGGSGSACCV